MRVTFDPAKNARNTAERSLSFERVADLEWETAVAVEDDRKDYGERRLRVMALLGPRLHVAMVTFRGDATHVISFRKANSRDIKRYAEEKNRRGLPPR
ncbi:MAG: BrnT family toxin [Hyphomicrobiales bacterium]|nr:BrnT family toxin [Hyphomicrobiales bacterium]